jgi:translocation and assembly module TamA
MLLNMFLSIRSLAHGGHGVHSGASQHRSREGSAAAALLLALLVALCACPAPSSAQEEDQAEYAVEFTGIPDAELLDLVRSVSDTFTYREQAPPSLSLLRNRAMNDIPQQLEAMASWGYFKADVQVDVQRRKDSFLVVFHVDSGPQFLLEEVSVLDHEGEPSQALPTPREILLRPGAPFMAGQVLDARDTLLSLLGNAGHPYPEIRETEVVADHATDRVRVRFLVSPGPVAWFGETGIEGLRRVREDHAARLVPWDEGERFRQELVEQARMDLIRSGLFSLVEIRMGEVLSATNRIPMFLRLRERKHRTTRVGINYTTDFGFGGLLGWEHRNLFGRGEHLETLLSVNELRQSLDATFQKPHFLREDQRLVLRTTLAQEETDAYESRSLRNLIRIERDLTPRTTVGAGVGYDFLDVEEDGSRDTFILLSLPLSFVRNTTDDLLDPSRGYTLAALVTPFIETFGDDVRYLRYDVSGSIYQEVLDNRRLILASRARYGQILGASRARVPATERFYAGGGGSVRGYPFQSLTPLDENDDPVGGQSVIELSFELRSRISERLGFAIFLDGGRAYEQDTPDIGEEIFWGTGLGFRYYTPIGPIRLDVAVPLQDREGVSESFQVYISIGQAF